MKNIICVAILFVLVSSADCWAQRQQTERINWLSFEEALKQNAVSPRNILIDVYTDWCGHCKTMEAQTFNNPVIARYINQNFYAIKFNAETTEKIDFAGHTFVNEGNAARGRRSTHQFASALGVSGYPTVAYFTGDLELIGAIGGFFRPEQMEPLLHFIAEEKYMSVSFEDFQKTFTGELKK